MHRKTQSHKHALPTDCPSFCIPGSESTQKVQEKDKLKDESKSAIKLQHSTK